jgi:hypothetical protein
MFCHIGLQAMATEISSYMIGQGCWKMCHCGMCMMMLKYMLAVLCEVFSKTPIMTDGWPLRGFHARHI